MDYKDVDVEADPVDRYAQMDRIESMLKELVEAKRELEAMAEALKGKSPLALMSMFK